MSKWIDVEADLGQPLVTYTLTLRGSLGRSLQNGLKTIERQGDVAKVAELLGDVVVATRPNLKGLAVIGFGINLLRGQWEIMVTHPSLKRQPMGSFSVVRLFPCRRCGKDVAGDTMTCMCRIEGADHEVCSEACAKGDEPITIVQEQQ